MAGRAQAKGGVTCLDDGPQARARARKSGPGDEEIAAGGTLRVVAVCLCFPAIREISRGRYQGAPLGVLSPLKKGRSTKSPTRAAARERRCLAV